MIFFKLKINGFPVTKAKIQHLEVGEGGERSNIQLQECMLFEVMNGLVEIVGQRPS